MRVQRAGRAQGGRLHILGPTPSSTHVCHDNNVLTDQAVKIFVLEPSVILDVNGTGPVSLLAWRQVGTDEINVTGGTEFT
jgi:hypothetical protein